MIDIIVRDKRLEGNPPKTTDQRVVFNIDETISLDSVLSTLAFFTKNNAGYRNILIMAHGLVDSKTQHGGLGIQLGKEGLSLQNVQKWNALKGKVREIVIYACAAAGVQVGMANEAKVGNGVYLCSQIAFYSGAIVTASTDIQLYKKGVLSLVWDIEMNFGEWEGTVLHFYPDGSIGMPNGSNVKPKWKGEQWVRRSG